MTKLLYITHLSGPRINRIWYSSIKAAHELEYEFHLACNMAGAEHPAWDDGCKEWGIITHQIDFDRNPLAPANVKAKMQLSELIKKEKFDIVHCNTPVGGLLGRICAKEQNVPYIIYQAHGFHFWKGAPLKNWLLYYPVEKWLAKKTDVLITINKEDYELAEKKFKPKKVEYVPGVGLDVKKFSRVIGDKKTKREELGLKEEDFVILSVGELIPRKNHTIVLDALGELKKNGKIDNIHYLICGQGELEEKLKEKTEKLNLLNHVHLLGFRNDVSEICTASDLFVFPSLQEGLPVALMEAMACGLPAICSNIRGNTDIIESGKNGEIVENKSSSIAEVIMKFKCDSALSKNYGLSAIATIKHFDLSVVAKDMSDIYSDKANRIAWGGG